MRPFFEFVKQKFQNCLYVAGVEVGVKRGDNAYEMMSELRPDLLVLVDKWIAYIQEEASNSEKQVGYLDQKVVNGWRQETFKKFANNDKVEILELDSIEAAKKLALRGICFDFIYIDACHQYTSVLSDCKAWFPLLKNEGIIGGHDFNNIHTPGVKKAVLEFASNLGVKLSSYGADWWISKIKSRESLV